MMKEGPLCFAYSVDEFQVLAVQSAPDIKSDVQTCVGIGLNESIGYLMSCRFTGAANFCNSLHIYDLSIVGHADPDIKI